MGLVYFESAYQRQALAYLRRSVDVHAEVALVFGVGGVDVVALPDGALEVLGHCARVVADADLCAGRRRSY